MAIMVPMRYLLFSNNYGDTLGGWCDFQSAHVTAEEAVAAFFNKYGPDGKAWYQIVDLMTMQTVEMGPL
jgi:hypothetical protein